jgi:hypothetical protein
MWIRSIHEGLLAQSQAGFRTQWGLHLLQYFVPRCFSAPIPRLATVSNTLVDRVLDEQLGGYIHAPCISSVGGLFRCLRGAGRLQRAVANCKRSVPQRFSGLKVDADALPPSVINAIKSGQVNLNDPAVTIQLLKLNAVVGVIGKVVGANGNSQPLA